MSPPGTRARELAGHETDQIACDASGAALAASAQHVQAQAFRRSCPAALASLVDLEGPARHNAMRQP